MKFEKLLHIASQETIFSSSLLMTAGEIPADVQKQLSRWTSAGKLIQLSRGLYCLARPYGRPAPHPYAIANRLRAPSYVSLQSGLAHYGMIPEHVPIVTSVTTGRPGEVSTPMGHFIFRHLKKSFFHGYQRQELGAGQSAFIATPEKCLLDLIYLTPRAEDENYLRELRLQNWEVLDMAQLREMARASNSPKLMKSVRILARISGEEEYEEL